MKTLEPIVSADSARPRGGTSADVFWAAEDVADEVEVSRVEPRFFFLFGGGCAFSAVDVVVSRARLPALSFGVFGADLPAVFDADEGAVSRKARAERSYKSMRSPTHVRLVSGDSDARSDTSNDGSSALKVMKTSMMSSRSASDG